MKELRCALVCAARRLLLAASISAIAVGEVQNSGVFNDFDSLITSRCQDNGPDSGRPSYPGLLREP